MDDGEFTKALADQMVEERQARRVAVSTVAEIAGLSARMVHVYERGDRNIPVNVLMAWCRAVGVDMLVLLAATEDRVARK